MATVDKESTRRQCSADWERIELDTPRAEVHNKVQENYNNQ